MQKHIATFFALQGWFIDGITWESRGRLIIRVRSPRNSACCPRCGSSSGRIHQYHKRRLLHGNYGTILVFLLVRKRRFKCRSCHRPFTETLPTISRYQRRTMQADRQALVALKDRSFASVARERSQDTSTVIRHTLHTLKSAPTRWPTRGEIRIGIDGHSARGKRMVRTVTELRTRRPLAILPDETKETLRAFFRSMPLDVKTRVVEVCLDLEAGDANAVREILGSGVHVVADHFHVIKLANDLIDQTRICIQDPRHPIPKKIWLKNKEHLSRREFQALVSWGDRYPALFKLWALKEDLRQCYEIRNKRVAAHRLRKVIAGYRSFQSIYSSAFARTLTRWYEPILNFFDRRTTNAYTEGLHRKFKLIQRISYGFKTLPTYMAKIMLACVPFFILWKHTIYN